MEILPSQTRALVFLLPLLAAPACAQDIDGTVPESTVFISPVTSTLMSAPVSSTAADVAAGATSEAAPPAPHDGSEMPRIGEIPYLGEIVVRGRGGKVEGTKETLSSKDVKNPSTALFSDAFNTIKKLPGVTGGEFSGLLFIRGGTPFENIAGLDGVVILFPYHWGGMVSIFNPDMVDTVDFYAGNFPARYGMATSGVIDVRTRNGSFRRTQGFVELNLTGGTADFETPLPFGRRSSLLLGARRTHLDLLLSAFSEAGGGIRRPHFSDAHLKVYSRIDPKNAVSYNSFHTADGVKYEFSEEDSERIREVEEGDSVSTGQSNLVNSVHWERDFGGKIYSHWTLAHQLLEGSFDMTQSGLLSQQARTEANMLQANTEWEIRPDARHFFELGYVLYHFDGYARYTGSTKYTKLDGSIRTEVNDFDYDGAVNYHGLFVQDEVDLIQDDLTLLAGLRHDIILSFRHRSLSPRTGLRKKLFRNTFLRLGWGLFTRFENDVRVFDDEKGNPDIRPERAVHYTVGVENESGSGYRIRGDLFYKDYMDLVTQDPDENFINGGEGHAYGVEAMLEKRETGRLNGWLAYTCGISRRKIVRRSEAFDPFNQPPIEIGEWYYPDYDQRHTFSLVANYRIFKGLSVYAGWDFHTGQPYTDVTDSIYVLNTEGEGVYLPVKDKHNDARLPDYHRLDLKLIREHRFFGLAAESYLQLMNAYAHKNVSGYHFSEDYREKKAIYYSPFMAMLGMKVSF